MNHSYQSDKTPGGEIGSPQGTILITAKKSLGSRIMNWWHSFASPPEPPENATVLQREKHRRARAVSTVVFFFLPVLLVGVPTALTMPNPWIFWVACSILVALLLAPFFNRAGHVFLAAILIILSLQFTIMFVILVTMPLNEVALQLYDLLSLVILLALAILPLRVIWVIACLDSIFVVLDFLYQPRTETFTQLLNHEGFIAILVRPIILILFLTGVSSFLLTSVAKAVRQNYETEFVANIERAAAQQNEVEVEAKRELEESIQQIVQAHTDTMNGRSRERISYPEAKVLWPLVGILNTLWTRLQRSQQREQEFVQLQEDIIAYNEVMQHTLQSPEKLLAPHQLQNVRSPLLLSIARSHRELLSRVLSQAGKTGGGKL
jgi:hypothetical protein